MIPELQKMVRRYLDEGRGRTPQSIAAASENRVSASTVRRIAQGEQGSVELQSVLAIVQVVASLDEAIPLLKKYYPSTGDYFEKVVSTTGASEIADPRTLHSLIDFESFVIVALASTPTGVTKAAIIERLGKPSATTLDKLVENGIIAQVSSGHYRSVQESIFPCDNTSVKAQIEHCLMLIRDEHIGKRRQHCNIVTDGVTADGQRKIHALLEKTKLELDALIANHKGDIPVFCSLLQGTFSTEMDHG